MTVTLLPEEFHCFLFLVSRAKSVENDGGEGARSSGKPSDNDQKGSKLLFFMLSKLMKRDLLGGNFIQLSILCSI